MVQSEGVVSKNTNELKPRTPGLRSLPSPFPVLPPLSVGEMTLKLYAALNYSQNSARDLRRALNGA